MRKKPILEIVNLRLSLDKEILRDINIQIENGDFTLIIGPNGAGKTSLLKSIAGIYEYEGQIYINGTNIKNWKKKELAKFISYQPQREEFSLPISVKDILLSGRFPYRSLFSTYDINDAGILRKVSEKFKLTELLERDINTLSGGERKRVLIASSYIQDVSLFMFDEPLSSLDPKETLNIINILDELKKEGKTIVVVSHDISPFYQMVNRIIALKTGKLLFRNGFSDTTAMLSKTFDMNFTNVKFLKGELFVPNKTE